LPILSKLSQRHFVGEIAGVYCNGLARMGASCCNFNSLEPK
jgi:hypothetical protein